jgi:hypothetical protein
MPKGIPIEISRQKTSAVTDVEANKLALHLETTIFKGLSYLTSVQLIRSGDTRFGERLTRFLFFRVTFAVEPVWGDGGSSMPIPQPQRVFVPLTARGKRGLTLWRASLFL